jgi:hypothetical protein
MQCLPNKHQHRWGIKFWMLWDTVSNYCGGLSHTEGPGLRKTRTMSKKMAWGKLLGKKKPAQDWRVHQERLPCLCQQLFHVCSTCPQSPSAKHLHRWNYEEE